MRLELGGAASSYGNDVGHRRADAARPTRRGRGEFHPIIFRPRRRAAPRAAFEPRSGVTPFGFPMSLPYQAMAGADASVESEPTPDDQAPSQSGPGRADHPSWYTCEHHLQERRKMITNM